MVATPEEVLDELRRLAFDAHCDIEDLEHGIRQLGISAPHGAGIGIDLIWTGTAISATLGHGTSIDLPGEVSPLAVSSLLTDLMGQWSEERWGRSRHALEVGEGPRVLKYTSSKTLHGGRRTPMSRRYAPYQRSRGD